MKTYKFDNERELKKFVAKNRIAITKINDVDFGELYPMLVVSNKHVTYYNVEEQEYSLIFAPYNVTVCVWFER